MGVEGAGNGQQPIKLFGIGNNFNPIEEQEQIIEAQAVVEPFEISPGIVPDFRGDFRRFQLTQLLVESPPPQQNPPDQIGSLKTGDSVPITIDTDDTQADVLRRAYAEFGTRAGLADADAFAAQMVADDAQIYHSGTNNVFTHEEFEARRTTGSMNIGATASDVTALRQTKIEELISYSLLDWSVTAAEQKQAVDILAGDPNLSATIERLESSGSLRNLIDRVDDTENRRGLINLLGRNLNAETAEIVRPHVERLDVKDGFIAAPGGTMPTTDVSRNLWQATFNLARLGVVPSDAPFDRSRFADLIGADNAAFSGVGATGANPTLGGVPLGDQFRLLRDDPAATRMYSNPLGDLNGYLDSITPQNRARQAELLVGQPISTTMPEIYGGTLPSRADVIRAAAARYNLQPELVTAFLLAEQRDQSRNEDAKDYTAATSIMQANTSIGLGQVVISTAQRNNLFSDLISSRTQAGMKHNDVARVLADDTFNIFAVAKYIRQTADQGARTPVSSLPRTQRAFPNIDMAAFSGNSSGWSADNIRALGSEYTSRAWDDKVTGWGDFVQEAYQDVRRSNVFR